MPAQNCPAKEFQLAKLDGKISSRFVPQRSIATNARRSSNASTPRALRRRSCPARADARHAGHRAASRLSSDVRGRLPFRYSARVGPVSTLERSGCSLPVLTARTFSMRAVGVATSPLTRLDLGCGRHRAGRSFARVLLARCSSASPDRRACATRTIAGLVVALVPDSTT